MMDTTGDTHRVRVTTYTGGGRQWVTWLACRNPITWTTDAEAGGVWPLGVAEDIAAELRVREGGVPVAVDVVPVRRRRRSPER